MRPVRLASSSRLLRFPLCTPPHLLWGKQLTWMSVCDLYDWKRMLVWIWTTGDNLLRALSLNCVGWRSFVLFSKDESVGFPFRNNGHSSSPTSLCVPDSEQYYFVVVAAAATVWYIRRQDRENTQSFTDTCFLPIGNDSSRMTLCTQNKL